MLSINFEVQRRISLTISASRSFLSLGISLAFANI